MTTNSTTAEDCLAKLGVGHNLTQEAPQAFAKAVVEVDGY